MCGIIGYLDDELGVSSVLDGLEKLEYRGYDSCGIAIGNDKFHIYKSLERINHLRSEIVEDGNIIIAHTRWATHGKVSIPNAHPISSFSDRFLIVHNGIIDNYQSLKDDYLANVCHQTETDTEVIINLIDLFSNQFDSIIKSINYVCSLLIGSFACLIIDKRDFGRIYFMKRNSPLLIGRGDGFYIASDVLAFDEKVKSFYRIKNDEIGYITKDNLFLYYHLDTIKPNFISFSYSNYQLSIGNYHHYMEKEIYEEPLILNDYLHYYFKNNDLCFDKELLSLFNNKPNIYLIGSGTSYHACLLGSYFFKTICRIPSFSYISSEFYLDEEVIPDNSLFIVISQSGETADLLKVVKEINKYPVISITNVVSSSIACMSDFIIDMKAGPEIAVASTKAYLSSSTLLYLLANKIAHLYPFEEYQKAVNYLPNILLNTSNIKNIAKKIAPKENLFFLGKGTDYFLACEASLKLKEISYIHSESFQAGELKHGTIALIAKNTPVIAIISNSKYHHLVRSAIQEVKARGALVYVISVSSLSKKDDDIILEDLDCYLNFLSISICFQLLAYYVALERGNDIDKPRNLAKSVTVL